MKKKMGILKILPAISIGTSLLASQNIVENKINKTNTQLNNDISKNYASNQTQQNNLTFDLNSDKLNKQLSANSFYYQNNMPTITNANGPVLLNDNGRTIAGYDWYGNASWFLTLNSQKDMSNNKSDAQASYYKYSNATSTNIEWDKVGSKIVDTAYLAQKDFLYVLTDTSYLFLINSTTGTINSVKKLEHNINRISLIDFNKSLYGWDSTKNNGSVYNIDTQKLTLTEAMKSTATGITGKYIFDILPLDVGYNVALLSDSAINDEATSKTAGSITLTAILVQDDGNKFASSSGSKQNNPIEENSITLSATSYKDIYSTTLKRPKSSSNILVVGDKVFYINLNKSAMENTTFQEITTTTTKADPSTGTGTTPKTIQNINSAFVDENDLVYLKDNSATVYQISLDNKINPHFVIQTSGSNYVFSNEEVNDVRIYPVIKTEGTSIARKGTGYLASPKDFKATGFLNGSALSYNFNSITHKPSFSLTTYSNSSPSAINETNIKTTNAITIDTFNTNFYADDISGELFIKTRLTANSWYDQNLGATTTSYVIGKWNCAKIESVTKWVSQNQFNTIGNGIFAKRSPDQISDQDVTKYAEQILNLPSAVTSAKWKNINIIVVKRDSTKPNQNGETALKDQITLKATIQYENASGTRVSYSMQENKYTVRTEARNYRFKFYGAQKTDPTEMETVDISNLGDAFTSFKNTIPSLIKPTSDNLEAFIEIQDKYPTDSRRVITISEPNDNDGSLIMKVFYNNLDPSTKSEFSIKYTGFATFTSASVSFVGDDVKDVPKIGEQNVFGDKTIKNITSIKQYVNYKTVLATEITPEKLNFVYQSDLSLMGFNPTLTIEKNKNGQLNSHDAEYGSIKIVLDYTNSFSQTLGIKLPKEYWDKFGLKEGKISQRYIGFLPIGETYNVSLKSYDSPEIQNLVNANNVNALVTTKELESTLDVKGYNNEVDESGKKLPSRISITSFYWNGENLIFSVQAQSNLYASVSTSKEFTISWSPKFAAVRQRNLAVASSTSVVGVALVSSLVSLYIIKRNKIRRLLK